MGVNYEVGDILRPELQKYLDSLRIKRGRQLRYDTLLAIILNKEKNQDIIEAIEKSTANSEMKKELIEWLNKSGKESINEHK